MLRKIIQIDEEKCNGCGICVDACHEGAIGLVDGKARLMREDYCDGLGDCLPTCPTGAITFVEREAKAYDEAEVKKNMARKRAHAGGCPGSMAKTMARPATSVKSTEPSESQLMQWPVQIKLVPVNAPFFGGADLLIAADCAAYAHGNFHDGFMRGKVTIIGCPKLDSGDYSEKLAEIIKHNDIKSITVARMEVPCCGGIEYAAKAALEASGKDVPLNVVVIGTDGDIRG